MDTSIIEVAPPAGGPPQLHAGELVAVAGASGAGKTTLLTALAAGADRSTGYVPQDDIVPLDLSVQQVLESAAALRLGAPVRERRRRVELVITTLGLGDRRHATVGKLSGGERKRVNVAVELLTTPELLLLDEPTSGLDPVMAATLLDHLAALAGAGTAVVLTTHSPGDIARCDRVVFLGGDGAVAYDGAPELAPASFGAQDLEGVYRALERLPRRERRMTWPVGRGGGAAPATTALTQWWALVRRNALRSARNRMTLAIIVGSPMLVTAMMVCLFPADALDAAAAGSPISVQVSYWLTFAAFFFGLTYGLLQVVPEVAIARRDRQAGVRVGAYVAAKLAVLAPLLVGVTVVMVGVLIESGRLPELGAGATARLVGTLSLVAVAALATGLLASAAVGDTTQATLALPMICFPQVLFAGALVSRPDMALPGRAMSEVLITRWGFDAVGAVLAGGRAGAASQLALTMIIAVALGATAAMLRRRTRGAR